jgi:hypothetical protein
MNISVDGALALIDKLKAMLAKMVGTEEAKRVALPTALLSSPCLDALCSPSPSFPPQH